MSEPFSNEDEQQLQALFDATAEEPTQNQLDHMARAAAQIPDARPLPWWTRYKPFLPWLALGAAALAAVVTFGGTDEPVLAPPGPVAVVSSPTSPLPVVPVIPDEDDTEILAVLDAADDDDEDDFDDPLAALDMYPTVTHPMDLLDPLFPSDDEIRLEVLNAAYGSVLEAEDG